MNRTEVIEKLKELKEKGFVVPSEDMIKTEDEIKMIKECAKINTEVLDLIEKNINEALEKHYTPHPIVGHK